MASSPKSEAARANGAKSRGPVTSEGKARSSRNAVKHGLTAQVDTLPGESSSGFLQLLDSHVRQFQPVGGVEEDLVHTLAVARWRLQRVPSLEFNLLDNELLLSKKQIAADFSEIDGPGRVSYVFKRLADRSQSLSLLIRYEASLTRVYDRTFKHLAALQKLRNEPKPPARDQILEPPAPSPDNSSGESMFPTSRVAAALLMLAQAPDPQFDVASVKPNQLGNKGGEGSTREEITATPGSLIMRNVTLRTCLEWAYGLRDFQISGPEWLASQRFDISAKASSPDADLHRMLRSLLADRFQVKSHFEEKERPVYELVAAKNGPRIMPSIGDAEPTFHPSGGELVFRNTTMGTLADRLSSRPFKLDLPVLDRTGLVGTYDFSLKLAASETELKHTLEGMEPGPSIFVYFEKQLGLKLESAKAPIDVLVIESIQKTPTEN